MKVTVTSDQLEDVKIDRRSTLMRKMAEMAVGEALKPYGDISGLNPGIVGYTVVGEEYPELWLASNHRILPHQFSAGILNSVIGHCSVMYHLTGPQIAVTTKSSMWTVALLQLGMGRSQLMVLCDYSNTTAVVADVVRKDTDA